MRLDRIIIDRRPEVANLMPSTVLDTSNLATDQPLYRWRDAVPA